MRVIIRDMFASDEFGIWITRGFGREKLIAKPVELVFEGAKTEAPAFVEPTITLSKQDAIQFFQEMLIAIKELGIISGTRLENNKELQALEKHLEDLRNITNNLLQKI